MLVTWQSWKRQRQRGADGEETYYSAYECYHVLQGGEQGVEEERKLVREKDRGWGYQATRTSKE